VPVSKSTRAESANWTDPLVLKLAGASGFADPLVLITELAERWLADAGVDRLPVDVFGLASLRGIRATRVRGLPVAGRVFAEPDGRVRIEINDSDSEERQRFSCAHELIHTAFPGFVSDQRYRADQDLSDAAFARSREEEESLCDRGAAALLMPASLLWSYDVRQGLRAVEKLARDAKVSLEAAANRLVEMSDKPAIFLVVEDGVPPSDRRRARRGDAVVPSLMTRYAVVSGMRHWLPRNRPIDDRSVLWEAAATRGLHRRTETLPGKSDRLFVVEAKAYPRADRGRSVCRVLAVAWPVGS
jgi:Zn-dependent peptidase ImmA (M78 family)